MKTFPALFAAELQKKTGATPLWILKMSAGGTTYYLSDNVFYCAPWGITTKAWVKKDGWGQLQEGISGTLDEFKISDFDVSCLIDPTASPNIEDLVLNYNLKATSVSLYMWLYGISDLPQEMFRGYIRRHPIPDENTVQLFIQDETLRFERTYIGELVDRQSYPYADPDEIGKLIPIPFGTVNKLRALAVNAGIKTSLPGNINETATAFSISDGTGLTAGKTVMIDEEEISIVSLAGDAITSCVRGVNGTLGATHQKGAVVWEQKASFDYVVSSRPLDSIPKVYSRIGQTTLNITAVCTRYTGKAGNAHAGYPGKAVVTVPGYITISQAISLLVNDGIIISDSIGVADGILVSDSIGVTDGIGVSDGILVSDTIGISDGMSISDLIAIADSLTVSDTVGVSDGIVVSDTIGVSTGSHGHIADLSVTQVASTALPAGGSYTGAAQQIWTQTVNFNTLAGTRESGSYQVSVRYQQCIRVRLSIANIGYVYDASVSGDGTINISKDISALNKTGNIIYVEVTTNTLNIAKSFQVDSAVRSFTISDSSTSSNAASGVAKTGSATRSGSVSKTGSVARGGTIGRSGAVTKSGSITKTGAASRTGSVTKTGSITKTGTASRTGSVTKTGSVSKTGTVTFAGNSVANTLIGEALLVDVVDALSAPQAVMAWLALTYCNVPNTQLIGSMPGSYLFNGAITEYRRALEWFNTLAFQCRSRFEMRLGVAKLLYRPDVVVSVKTIDTCRVYNGRKDYSRDETSYSDIINKIDLLFDRDYSKDRGGADTYRGFSGGVDVQSVADHGVQQRPELFMFDFVTDQEMADSERGFYLSYYANQHWSHRFNSFLWDADLEYADGVTLAFSNNASGEVMQARLSPGDAGKSDLVEMIVVV